jgi:sorbitol/mannitol transport system permease protein
MSSVTDVAPVAATRTPEGQPRRPRKPRGGLLLGLVAWVIGFLFVVPVLWMVLTSFHSEEAAATNPPSVFAPLTLDGYRTFFGVGTGTNPWPSLLNSLTASLVSTLLVLRLVMFFFLSTRFLPVVAGILPIYLFAQWSGLLDNIWLLVVLYTSMNLPIAVWMMRSFLAEVPVEILEAAAMDGAGLLRTLRQVVAPIVLPGIAATSLICFIFSWNELLLARTLTGTRALTAPVYLTGFVTSQGLFLAQMCAAAFVVSLPVLAAGFAAQDKLVQGLSLGAVK